MNRKQIEKGLERLGCELEHVPDARVYNKQAKYPRSWYKVIHKGTGIYVVLKGLEAVSGFFAPEFNLSNQLSEQHMLQKLVSLTKAQQRTMSEFWG